MNNVTNFKNFIVESQNTLHAFDMDETLFTHDPGSLFIHVKDENGNRIQSLSNQQFNTHKLEPGHSYDFSDFRSSSKLHQTGKPIRQMLAKMKAIHNNGGKVEILTARSDFDDQPKFAEFMKKYGIDINKVHVRRAGNKPGDPAVRKRDIVHNLINQNGYKNVHLYDDSKDNLAQFLSLKQQHPGVNFNAHHVSHNDDTGETTVRTTKV
jgi:hypothetical protein